MVPKADFRETRVADIINLRHARKARARRVAEVEAAENRARFGRTKAQKARDDLAASRLRDAIEGARREPVGDEEQP